MDKFEFTPMMFIQNFYSWCMRNIRSDSGVDPMGFWTVPTAKTGPARSKDGFAGNG